MAGPREIGDVKFAADAPRANERLVLAQDGDGGFTLWRTHVRGRAAGYAVARLADADDALGLFLKHLSRLGRDWLRRADREWVDAHVAETKGGEVR